MASKVQVVEVPADGPVHKAKPAPPPKKSDFPATPAQAAEQLEQDKLGDTAKPSKEEAARIGGKPGELKELDGKPITTEDAAHIAAAEAAAGKATGPGSLAAKAQSAAAANENEGNQTSQKKGSQTSQKGGNQTSQKGGSQKASNQKKEQEGIHTSQQGGNQGSQQGGIHTSQQGGGQTSQQGGYQTSQQTPKPSANGSTKPDAPEALSDKPGETESAKKRVVTEPKVHYYKSESEKKEESNEGTGSFASALKRPKEVVEIERRDEAESSWASLDYRKWLVPGAVAVLAIGVTYVVVSATLKSRQRAG